MTLDNIINQSIRSIISEEKNKKKRLGKQSFTLGKGYSSLIKQKQKEEILNFSLQIEQSKETKVFKSDIQDRKFQRRNAFAECCHAERKLMVKIVVELKRESYMQELIS